MATWRDTARPIIAEIIERVGVDSPDLRRALRDAYPFGECANHPYKIWLNFWVRLTIR